MASGDPDSQAPSPAAVPVTKQRSVWRAMLRGAVFGAVFTTSAMVLIALGQFAVNDERNQPQASEIRWAALSTPVARAAIVVLFCAVLASLLFGVATAFSARPQTDQSDVFADREGGPARPYAGRLSQFLHEDVRSAPGDAPAPRPIFFVFSLPDRPKLPKSASYIRAILWHIHRLLGRHS